MGKPEELKYRQVGLNILITIDKKQYSKTEKDKVKRDAIINKIKLYNKANTVERKKALITLFSKKQTEDNKKEATKKGVKKAIKKETKKTTKVTKAKKDKETLSDDLKRFIELGKKGEADKLTKDEMSELKTLITKFAPVEKKVEKAAMSLSDMIEVERESARTLGRNDGGYRHPVTGRTWNGEKYQ